MKMFFKSIILVGTIFSLIGVSGSTSESTLLHHHHKPNNTDKTVADVTVKYENYDAKGNKVSSGNLNFTTKYLDTDDAMHS